MKKLLSILCLSLAITGVLSFKNSANAGLTISGNVVQDSNTGLEWLVMSETVNKYADRIIANDYVFKLEGSIQIEDQNSVYNNDENRINSRQTILISEKRKNMPWLPLLLGNESPTVPKVQISPKIFTDSEFQTQYATFKLVASAQSTDPEGDTITYKYKWYKNGEEIPGANTKELTASLMGRQGHTVRGYEYKCHITASDTHGNMGTAEYTVAATGPAFTPQMRGAYFKNYFRVFGKIEDAAPSLVEMQRRTNCNLASIGILYFQSDQNSTKIYEIISDDRMVLSTISESDLIGQIQAAKKLGMKVLVEPQIWIEGYNVGHRDQIPGTPEWFQSYQAIILHLADICELNGVDIFSLGCELRATQDKEDSWRNLIQAARQHYSGLLTYSSMTFANTVETIEWWDALDLIGVSTSFVIPNGTTDMTVSEMLQYTDYADRAYSASVKFNKQVIVTEVVAFSIDGVVVWGNSAPEHSTTPDWQEQADFFQVVFETYNNKPWVAGLVVADWAPTQETWYQLDPQWETGTAFLEKYAEKVIYSWFTK